MLRPRRRPQRPAPHQSDKTCPRATCGGTMMRGKLPCTDPRHGVSCTVFHYGWRCRECGFMEDLNVNHRPGMA